MTNSRTQLRGNCQCCGRDQAATSGRIAQHGYTVENGWFQGVCSGHQFPPLQLDRSQTDRMVEEVLKEAAALEVRADRWEAGDHPADFNVDKPNSFSPRRGQPREQVLFSSLGKWHQIDVLKSIVWNMRNRAAAGRGFAKQLTDLANAVHGQPLREVVVEASAAPIPSGERRQAPNGQVLTVRYTERGRVYWKNERGFGSWTGVAAWRKYPTV